MRRFWSDAIVFVDYFHVNIPGSTNRQFHFWWTLRRLVIEYGLVRRGSVDFRWQNPFFILSHGSISNAPERGRSTAPYRGWPFEP